MKSHNLTHKNNDEIVTVIIDNSAIIAGTQGATIGMTFGPVYDEIGRSLFSLKTTRGGGHAQQAGFLMEHYDAFDRNYSSALHGKHEVYRVLDDNSAVDVVKIAEDGTTTNLQYKVGYETNSSVLYDSKYNSSDFVLDKGNPNVKKLQNKGKTAYESKYTKTQLQNQAKVRDTERLLLNKAGINVKNAPISSTLYTVSEELKASVAVSVKDAVNPVVFSSGVSIGKNIYYVMQGEETIKEIAIETLKTGIKTGVASAGTKLLAITGGALAEKALVDFAIYQTAKNMIFSVGALTASVPIAAGPMFLIGIAVGCAYTGLKIASLVKKSNNKHMALINNYLDETIRTLSTIQKTLETVSDSKIAYEYKCIDDNLQVMKTAILENKYDVLNDALDSIMLVFDKTLHFQTQEDFDDFFYSNTEYKI